MWEQEGIRKVNSEIRESNFLTMDKIITEQN